MILDQVFTALGCSRVYPLRLCIVLFLALHLTVHNLQKVPLLSWFPPMFCAVVNDSGTFPYKAEDSLNFKFKDMKKLCPKKNDCVRTRYMEDKPAKPACSELGVVKDFPKCVLNDSSLFYQSPSDETTVMTFDSICSRSYIVRLEDAFYFIGSAFAYIICVPAADTIGRKPVIAGMCFAFIFVDSMMALSSSSIVLITMRFLGGMGYATLTGVGTVLMYEMNPPHRRIWMAMVAQTATTTAQITLPVSSYVIPKWRPWLWYEAILFVVAFGLIFTIPESIRWQLNQYKSDPILYRDFEIMARKTLKKIVEATIKCNPKNITELVAVKEELEYEKTLEIGNFSTVPSTPKFDENLDSSSTSATRGGGSRAPRLRRGSTKSTESKKVSFRGRNRDKNTSKEIKVLKLNLLESNKSQKSISGTLSGESEQGILTDYQAKKKRKMTPVLWRCLFLFIFMRTIVVIYYYALALSSNELFKSDRHVNMILLGLAEIPVPALCFILDRKCPRRVGVSLVFMMAGLPFLVMGTWNFIQKNLPVIAKYVFYLMGKLAVTAAVLLVNLFQTEVFPTTVRTTMMGICSAIARIFTIFSTLSPTLFKTHPEIIVTLFGTLTLVCAGLTWLLPETKNRKLPQTPSDLQTIHLETKSLAETIRSARTSAKPVVNDGIINEGMAGQGGMGESGVEDLKKPRSANRERGSWHSPEF